MKTQELVERVIQRIVQEAELRDDPVLYHRTRKDFKPGDVITPQPSRRTGQGEGLLERIRIDEFPDKPSRFDSVYMHLVPRGRFAAHGKSYPVRPIGKTHVTDSAIVDALDGDTYPPGQWDPDKRIKGVDLAKLYWQGVPVTRDNIERMEVLAPKAIVIGPPVDETHRLNEDDVFSLPFPIRGSLDIDLDNYGKAGAEKNHVVYIAGEETPLDVAEKLIDKWFQNPQVVDNPGKNFGFGVASLVFTVPPGTPLQVTRRGRGQPHMPHHESPGAIEVKHAKLGLRFQLGKDYDERDELMRVIDQAVKQDKVSWISRG